jgi:hypothetical protein
MLVPEDGLLDDVQTIPDSQDSGFGGAQYR